MLFEGLKTLATFSSSFKDGFVRSGDSMFELHSMLCSWIAVGIS